MREAAGLAGRSFSFWGQVERGEKTVTNRRILEAMAGALRVHPSELTEQPWTRQDVVSAETHAGLTAIETALERYKLGVDPDVPARAWPQIADDFTRLVTTMRWTADYTAQCELGAGGARGAARRVPAHAAPTPCGAGEADEGVRLSDVDRQTPWWSRTAEAGGACRAAVHRGPR